MAETKYQRRGYFRSFGKRLEDAGDEVMKAWRTQARRHDRVGDVSYHGLEMVHGGVEFAARSLSRLERATQPPHRAAPAEPHLPAHEPAHRARPTPPTPAPRRSAPQHREPETGAS